MDSISYPDLLRLGGRGFLVVGAGAGIGGQTALALSQCGAKVVCADLKREVAEACAERCGGVAVEVDISDPAALERLVARTTEELGDSFAGMVDVVGVPLPGELTEQAEGEFSRQIDLVLRHSVRLTQLVAGPLADNGGGSIVLIGSLAGARSTARLALYGAAKAALNSFAQTAALELGATGVRVNVVSPGRILASGVVKPSEETIARIAAAVPLRRLGVPRDIAGAVLFMMSDLAAYVTGAVLPVDGGISPVSALPS